MKTLNRSVGRVDIGGEPLPAVFQTFEKNKIILRRAEVSMIAGAPGVGKSTLALAIALKTKVPTLYVSADTNAHTMAMRLLSMITTKSQEDSERILNINPKWAAEQLTEHSSHIFWSFDSAPSLSDLDDEVSAFEELMGSSPHLIVVDNLIDIAMDGAEEWGGLRSALKELKFLARDTNASVLILHHTSEASNGDPCPPRSALQGKVAQLPALICTVGQDSRGFLAVAPVKNRYGKADASGATAHWLQFNPEFMFIADLPERI
jgi:predicted ATP-dependent serine protease